MDHELEEWIDDCNNHKWLGKPRSKAPIGDTNRRWQMTDEELKQHILGGAKKCNTSKTGGSG